MTEVLTMRACSRTSSLALFGFRDPKPEKPGIAAKGRAHAGFSTFSESETVQAALNSGPITITFYVFVVC